MCNLFVINQLYTYTVYNYNILYFLLLRLHHLCCPPALHTLHIFTVYLRGMFHGCNQKSVVKAVTSVLNPNETPHKESLVYFQTMHLQCNLFLTSGKG